MLTCACRPVVVSVHERKKNLQRKADKKKDDNPIKRKLDFDEKVISTTTHFLQF